LRLDLHVAHLNHGLRGAASDEDARFVADLAGKWGLPCTVGKTDVRSLAAGRSLEEAARLARYRFLAQVAAGAGGSAGCEPRTESDERTVAVGHNADDQAETVLMHFLRGAGTAGLRGMLPRTPLADYRFGQVSEARDVRRLWLVRPLLGVPRREIERYCAEHELEPRFDRSNEDLTLFRNRLRRELLPLLEQHNPAIRDLLVRTAEVMAGNEEILRASLDAAWREVEFPAGPQEVQFDLAQWRALSLGLQRATLRQAIHLLRHELRDIGWEHVERAVWLARDGATGQSATLPRGLVLQIGYGLLRIAEAGAPWRTDLPSVSGAVLLAAPGVTPLDGGWRVIAELEPAAQAELPYPAHASARPRRATAGRWEAWLDAEALGPRLLLRPRRPGDRFLPQGFGGHSVKLNEFMINQKLPKDARAGWPLLEGGQGLAWVCGWRVDERAAVSASSRQVWHLRFERGEVNE
jgi:tRNA(Ile)-lysidine synthase